MPVRHQQLRLGYTHSAGECKPVILYRSGLSFYKMDPSAVPGCYDGFTEVYRDLLGTCGGSGRARFGPELLRELMVSTPVSADAPPRVYLFGQSGAGKSSLLNALVGEEVAAVGDIKPTTDHAQVYESSLSDSEQLFTLIDSRGLFESVPAGEHRSYSPATALLRDLKRYAPDVLFHVSTPEGLRAGQKEFGVLEQVNKTYPGGLPPTLCCLTHLDTHQAPTSGWPPSPESEIADILTHSFDLLTKVLSDFGLGSSEQLRTEPIEDETPHRGVVFSGSPYIGAVPVYSKEPPYWNVETVVTLLTNHLSGPRSRGLDIERFRRQSVQQQVRRQTETVATAVGYLPTKAVIVPDDKSLEALQRYLVFLIGALTSACSTVDEAMAYFDAVGNNVLDSQKIGVAGVPLLGSITSDIVHTVGGISGTPNPVRKSSYLTYQIGRSAERHFLHSMTVHPDDFATEAREHHSGSSYGNSDRMCERCLEQYTSYTIE